MGKFNDMDLDQLTVEEYFHQTKYSLTHKFNQRLYMWTTQIRELAFDVKRKLDETGFLSDFNTLSPTNSSFVNSPNESDSYCLNSVTIFQSSNPFLDDGQQRTVTIMFLLSEIKKELILLKHLDKSGRISNHINMINKLIYDYYDRIRGTVSNDDLIGNFSLRLSYNDMDSYNNVFIDLINFDLNLVKNKYKDKYKNANKIEKKDYEIRISRLIDSYGYVKDCINEITDKMSDTNKINYLYRLSSFLMYRSYFNVIKYKTYNPKRRIEQFISLNNRGLGLGDFDKYKTLLSTSVFGSNRTEEEKNEMVSKIYKNLELALIIGCKDDDNFKNLLEFNYQVKDITRYDQSKIIKQLESKFETDKDIFNSLNHSEYLLDTANLLSDIQNYGTIPDIVKNKFITHSSKIAILEDLSNRIYYKNRWYSKQFFLTLYKNLDVLNSIDELVHCVDRFHTFIVKYADLGVGGKSGNDVESALIKFHKIIREENWITKFEDIFFNNPTLSDKFSVTAAITSLFEKTKFEVGEVGGRERRMLADIEYEFVGGFSHASRKIDISDSTNTVEHISSRCGSDNNPLINMIGNVPGFLTRGANSKLQDSPYPIKRTFYLNESDSNVLKHVANTYTGTDFSKDNIIENAGVMVMKYLESAKYFKKPNPRRIGQYVDNSLEKRDVIKAIESKKIELKSIHGIL